MDEQMRERKMKDRGKWHIFVHWGVQKTSFSEHG